jgi:predicted RNase H-like HicB family nuclease
MALPASFRYHAMMTNWTAVYLPSPLGYVAFVEELPGANTQGETLEEARANLQEAIQLVLEANRTLAEEAIQGKEAIRELLPFSDITTG